jgi:hypothetical protein
VLNSGQTRKVRVKVVIPLHQQILSCALCVLRLSSSSLNLLCVFRLSSCALRLASCILRLAPFLLRLAACTLRLARCALHLASCVLHPAPCALRLASCRHPRSKGKLLQEIHKVHLSVFYRFSFFFHFSHFDLLCLLPLLPCFHFPLCLEGKWKMNGLTCTLFFYPSSK